MGFHSKRSTNYVYFTEAYLLLFLWGPSSASSGSTIGVNYGFDQGTNLPSPSEVVALLKANNIDKVKIFNTNAMVLQAFQQSGIALIVAAANNELQGIASSQANANQWVQRNIVPYASSIKYIAVGNEVIENNPSFSADLLPAMKNIDTALSSNGLGGKIKITTPMAFNVLQKSFPPSEARFKTAYEDQIKGILELIQQTESKFTANVYPFLAYRENPSIDFGYVTFGNSPGADDNGLHYNSLFDAQVDALVAAMSSLGYPNVPLLVGESGWPTQGDQYASMANAKAYNNGLVASVRKGSPKRPNVLIETYLFELFNEDKKSGDAIEHYWGVFDGKTKLYDMTF